MTRRRYIKYTKEIDERIMELFSTGMTYRKMLPVLNEAKLTEASGNIVKFSSGMVRSRIDKLIDKGVLPPRRPQSRKTPIEKEAIIYKEPIQPEPVVAEEKKQPEQKENIKQPLPPRWSNIKIDSRPNKLCPKCEDNGIETVMNFDASHRIHECPNDDCPYLIDKGYRFTRWWFQPKFPK